MNNSLVVPRIGALLDFYSDRAVAHASFFVASIFGLVTFLAIIQQLKEISSFSFWASILLFLLFSYMGYFTLMRFGFYANIAELLTYGLDREQTLEKISAESGKTALGVYMKEKEKEQVAILLPKRVLTKYGKKGKYILGASYWTVVVLLGSVVYSRFLKSIEESSLWFGVLATFILLLVIIPPLKYHLSRRTKHKPKERR